MKKKLACLIFDVDGLLLDTEAVWSKAWEEVGKEMGIPNADTLFSYVIGVSGEDLVRVVYEHMEDHVLADELIQRARKRGLERLETELTLKNGAKEILESAKQAGYRLAVATTTRKEATVERLTRMGILSYFDEMVCGDEVIKRKPDPRIYETVLKKMGISPEKAIVLEDSHYGVEAASRAKIDCIQVPDLSATDEHTKSLAVSVEEDLNSAWQYILEHYELEEEPTKQNLFFQLFQTFFMIGAFTFGGGYAMVPLISHAVVEERKWIKEEDMLDVVSIAESTPGPIAINSATFIGYQVAGTLGSFFATLGVVLPSFLIILLISTILRQFQNNVWIGYAFYGIRAGVLALLISAVWNFYKVCPKGVLEYGIMLFTFLGSLFFDFSVIYLLIVCMVLGVLSRRGGKTE